MLVVWLWALFLLACERSVASYWIQGSKGGWIKSTYLMLSSTLNEVLLVTFFLP